METDSNNGTHTRSDRSNTEDRLGRRRSDNVALSGRNCADPCRDRRSTAAPGGNHRKREDSRSSRIGARRARLSEQHGLQLAPRSQRHSYKAKHK
jgi:hypothetical protein